jgi:hypothetical protein
MKEVICKGDRAVIVHHHVLDGESRTPVRSFTVQPAPVRQAATKSRVPSWVSRLR